MFVLNSIEDKDSRFISGEQFDFMVPVLFLFLLGFKFKEQSFRVYRSQWDILIILTEKSVFLDFHYWQLMRERYVVLVASRDLIARCLLKCQLLFQIRD